MMTYIIIVNITTRSAAHYTKGREGKAYIRSINKDSLYIDLYLAFYMKGLGRAGFFIT